MDRPGEVRRVINFKRLALTDIKLDIPRLAKKKVLSEALSTAGGLLLGAAASCVSLPCTQRMRSIHNDIAQLGRSHLALSRAVDSHLKVLVPHAIMVRLWPSLAYPLKAAHSAGRWTDSLACFAAMQTSS